jgi:hypothetical protein
MVPGANWRSGSPDCYGAGSHPAPYRCDHICQEPVPPDLRSEDDGLAKLAGSKARQVHGVGAHSGRLISRHPQLTEFRVASTAGLRWGGATVPRSSRRPLLRVTTAGVFAGLATGVSIAAFLLMLTGRDPYRGLNAGFIALCLNCAGTGVVSLFTRVRVAGFDEQRPATAALSRKTHLYTYSSRNANTSSSQMFTPR